MSKISSKQRAHLRKLAHRLKPVVHVGAEGVSTALLASLDDAFRTRELLKVKLQESAPLSVRDTAKQIAEVTSDVHPVQTIGRTIVLYRADPEKPQIKLPG